MGVKTGSIELLIDELRLDGRFSREEGMRVAAGLEKELSRLFSEHGIPITLRADNRIESISGPVAEVRRVSQAEKWGTVLGRAIYEGLGGSLRRPGRSGASRPSRYE